jgi:hypothetical protein
VIAAAITFPLVWGWIHFETVPATSTPTARSCSHRCTGFPSRIACAFVVFHGLVWSSFLVIAGVMLAFRRRMIDHGAVAVQQFGQDILPLLLLFAISVSGLMLTASYTWMKGYAYDFLAILHAATVIVTLLWLPFGKLFHVFSARRNWASASTRRRALVTNRRCAIGVINRSRRCQWSETSPSSNRSLAFGTNFRTAVTIRRSVRGVVERCSGWRRARCGRSS